MIPASFEYIRVDSTEQVIAGLAEYGDEAKILAGGMSLIPLMKLRLATPTVLLDAGRLDDLSYISDKGDYLALGALTRHRDLETSDLLAKECAVLRGVAAEVGDNQVRHRGTIGGSVAHGDPASDLPAVLVALEAEFVVEGPSGSRTLASANFFKGFHETELSETEILTEIRVPKTGATNWSYHKFNRRAQDWAIVGALAFRAQDSSRVALVNMGSVPIRATAVEQALASGASHAEAADQAAVGTEAPEDSNASSAYREHLSRVLVKRALDEALV